HGAHGAPHAADGAPHSADAAPHGADGAPHGADGPRPHGGDASRAAALGGDRELRLELGRADDPTSTELAAAVEHAVRALRAAARRWAPALPLVTIGTAPATGRERAAARIVAFLGALASVQHARNACVVVGHRMIAWAHTPDALDEARWPLLERR